MDNMNTENTAFERYVDATVELFMEQYTKELVSVLEQAPAEQMPYPDKLDQRCLALIQKARRKEHLRKFNAAALVVLRRVAIIVVALLSLASILFVTVEAFREPIIDFFFKEKDGFWEISGDSAATKTLDGWKELDDPLAGLLPEEYKRTHYSKTENEHLHTEYQNEHGDVIWLSVLKGSGTLYIDSENADLVDRCIIGEFDAIYVEKDGYCNLVWANDLTNQKFSLYAKHMERDEFMDLAKAICANTAK